MYYAITHSPILAPMISVSYGECEAGAVADGSYTGFYLPLLQQANAEGITVLAPSGDSGAADCDAGNSSVDGLAVDMPEALNVTSVGGTEFQEGADIVGLSWNNPPCVDCPKLPDRTFPDMKPGSARSYIPEAWNDTNVANQWLFDGADRGRRRSEQRNRQTSMAGGHGSAERCGARRAGRLVQRFAASGSVLDLLRVRRSDVKPTHTLVHDQWIPECQHQYEPHRRTGHGGRDIGRAAGDGGNCGADQPANRSHANERFGQHQSDPVSARGAHTHGLPRRHYRE